MDNSRRFSTAEDTNCTSPSMYLSFDAESSISSLAFKTLETSTAFELNADITNMNEQSENMNSTLEANSLKVHYADSTQRTVKLLETVITRGPLRALQEDIINDKVLYSTPTKEIDEISVANIDMDMKSEFSDLKKKHEKSLHPLITIVEDNKENAHPKIDNFSTLSVSSSIEIETSIIERKTNIAENQVLNGKDSIELLKVIEYKEAMPKINIQRIPKEFSVPTNMNKSACSSGSKMNRPYHKPKSKTQVSLLAPNTKLKCVRDEASEMPKILKKMLKISETRENKQSMILNNIQQKPKIDVKQSLKLSINTQAEKRSFNYTQRLPIMAKTKLNSPNRKMPRKSVLTHLCKSMLADAISNKTRKNTLVARQTAKLTVPTRSTPALAPNSNNSIEEQIQSKIPSTRKSLYVKLKSVTDSKNSLTTATKSTSNGSVKTSFACFVCREKFSLKSLLNAHMRSHEDDTPALVRPTSVTKSNFSASCNTLSNDESKCKYCDKKFALLRTLHIHLMENCVKIPPKDKRKLQFTELNHVEKAQLPAVFHTLGQETSNLNSYAATLASSNSSIKSDKRSTSCYSRSNLNRKHSPIPSEKKDITELANELVAAVDGVLNKMAPPSLPKARNTSSNMPHSGVFRTPNKAVPCHLCKKTFKNVFDYTNHSMIMHKTIVYSPPTSESHNDSSVATQHR